MKELAESGDFESREEVIIRDIFITNMLDDDIQSELLRDTVDPERALNIAVNMEMGHQNQQRISSNNNNNASGSAINAIQSFNRFRSANARGNQKQAELQSIEQRLASVQVVAIPGLQRIVRFSPLWARNAIIVAYSIFLQRYVGKT